MKLLLDTHVLLWWLDNPNRLSRDARAAIADYDNLVLISAAVIWEIVLKSSLGKLIIPVNLEEVLEENNFHHLPVFDQACNSIDGSTRIAPPPIRSNVGCSSN